jgi:WD40 repeat protein
MTERELRERLRATGPSNDPLVEERAWQVVRSAYGPTASAPARRSWRLTVSAITRVTVPAIACLAALAAIALATASAPRQALARWLRQAIGLSAQPHPRPLLAGLPGGGRLLVNSPNGPWIVQADGNRRHLGPYLAAAWSPHSLFVVAWRGSELAALDLRGHPQWTLTANGRVTVARWSPDGFRIAYIAGRSLWIVAGDGSGPHQLRGSVEPVIPAWEPHTGDAHRIAFVDRFGHVELRDADTGALSWRIKPIASPQQLLWSPDGTQLLAVAADRLSVYDADGRAVATRTLGPGATAGVAVPAPAGDRVALVLHQSFQAATSVGLVHATRAGLRAPPQILFSAAERITGLSWSPNGRWLLAASPSADQWIYIRALKPTRLAAISRIDRQFESDHRQAQGFPTPGGWQP